ncbi:MAG: hypothetical protein V1661_03090 [bacterium]
MLEKPEKEGDFDLLVHKEKRIIFIPSKLYNLIVIECNARNMQNVFDYICAHPSTIAKFLHWKEIGVMQAVHNAIAYLNAAFGDLNSTPRTKE